MSRLVTRLSFAAAAAWLTACSSPEPTSDPNGFATGPLMLPGENCLRCHSPQSSYPNAAHWSLAGTVFDRADERSSTGVADAVVAVTDAAGRKLMLTTNSVGNFYTSEPLTGPLQVSVEFQGRRAEMPIKAPAGSCNACHSAPNPSGGATGRIRVP